MQNLDDRFTTSVGTKDAQTRVAPVESAPRVDDTVDARVLRVTEDVHGLSHKPWRGVAAESCSCQFDDHRICSVDDSGVSAAVLADIHFKRCTDPRRPEEWCRVLCLTGTHDHVNLGGCACLEEASHVKFRQNLIFLFLERNILFPSA